MPWPRSFNDRPNLVSPEAGVTGRMPLDGVLVIDLPIDGATCVSEEVDLLKGFFKTGKGPWSIDGIGGTSLCLLLPLLKALRIEANEGFFENPVLVDCWEECENGVAVLLVYRVVAEPVESSEADESPRLCEKKLRSGP